MRLTVQIYSSWRKGRAREMHLKPLIVKMQLTVYIEKIIDRVPVV